MPGPTVRSRRLAWELRQARKAAGLQQKDVARHVNRTVQWMSRVEKAATCRPSVGDVRTLLALYAAHGADVDAERIALLAAAVKQPGWWHDYDVTAALATLLSLEGEASCKRMWEPAYVPGLLQTEEYARAVIAAGLEPVTARDADEMVRVRMERQKALYRPQPLRVHCILDQAVLCRPAGPPALMRAQLRHLADVSELGNVTVRVLPFAAGPHPAMGAPFAIFSFPDPDDHDIVCTDTMSGPVYAEAREHIDRARRAFAHLADYSLPEYESIALSARLADGLLWKREGTQCSETSRVQPCPGRGGASQVTATRAVTARKSPRHRAWCWCVTARTPAARCCRSRRARGVRWQPG